MNTVLPAGVVNVVTGENELGAILTSHPDIAKVTFTGSTPTGRKIMANAAATVKRLTLELGGNDAGIVLPDVDPASIAEGLFWGAFINNGQTCAALKRLYVHDSIYDAICDALVAYSKNIVVGDGVRRYVDPWPGSKPDAARYCCRFCGRGQSQRWTGSDRRAGFRWSGLFLSHHTGGPTSIMGCKLVDLEQFGPALPIIRYTDLDAVIAKANDNPAGLGGSVWSGNLAEAKRVASRLECGSVWINRHGAIQPNAPFGGVKQSGVGVEFGAEGLKEFTTIQTVFC